MDDLGFKMNRIVSEEDLKCSHLQKKKQQQYMTSEIEVKGQNIQVTTQEQPKLS